MSISKLKKSILAAIILFSVSSKAGWKEDLEVKLRPLIEKYIGSDVASKLFGVKKTLEMPVIPKVESNAKQVVVESAAESKNKINISNTELEKYHASYINELYEVVLRSKASRDDIAKWLNVLVQGGSREGIYRGLVLGRVYQSFENEPPEISNSTVDFAQLVLKDFVNYETTKEKLLKINIYSIKRITTEKALNVFDTLIRTNEDDAYKWYAILSAKMAERFGAGLGSNELRVNSDSMVHYNWAKNVNVQMIKSEMILKIHKIFNATKP